MEDPKLSHSPLCEREIFVGPLPRRFANRHFADQPHGFRKGIEEHHPELGIETATDGLVVSLQHWPCLSEDRARTRLRAKPGSSSPKWVKRTLPAILGQTYLRSKTLPVGWLGTLNERAFSPTYELDCAPVTKTE